MRVVLMQVGDDLFVQGEWQSVFGAHQHRLTEDLPANIREAAEHLIAWANEEELARRTQIESQLTVAELDAQIGLFQQLRQAALDRAGS